MKALHIRNNIIQFIQLWESIILDFKWTNPTHSFLDELIWVLIDDLGGDILSKIEMKNVAEWDKNIIRFIVNSHIQKQLA